ncbi:MAG: TIGR01458 family HAD-type hydrolase [Gammaproteobacteria bacterium]|nr:TIGR01458 family HAD-type hydrolase [Gammaproteobacteria bacterium]
MPKAVLLDVSGVLQVGDEAIDGAIDAVDRLRDAGMPFRLVSNTSRKTAASMLEELNGLGFSFAESELLTAPVAARTLLQEKSLKPFLLVHPDLEPEFSNMEGEDAVLVGDAGEAFTHERLDAAFRLLMDGKPLYATGINRYFRDGDRLGLDAGPFVKALEYAAGVEATITGKPSRDFFAAAASSLGVSLDDLLMIGDDVENDVLGARDAELEAWLVRTGKFTAGDEERAGEEYCFADIAAATSALLD